MALVTLQTIFQDAFPAYEQTPSLARPRPQSRARHHAVPDGGPGRPCPGVSRRPYGAHLVQLLSPPGVSPMRISRPSAGWPSSRRGSWPVTILSCHLHPAP